MFHKGFLSEAYGIKGGGDDFLKEGVVDLVIYFEEGGRGIINIKEGAGGGGGFTFGEGVFDLSEDHGERLCVC